MVNIQTIEPLERSYDEETGEVSVRDVEQYSTTILALIDQANKTANEKAFITDTINTMVDFIKKLSLSKETAEYQLTVQTASKPGPSLEPKSEPEEEEDTTEEDKESSEDEDTSEEETQVKKRSKKVSKAPERLRINLNQLVVKPATFDGRRPNARKWIDDFSDAIEANDWSDQIAVKYFSTFLSDTAYTWFKTEIRPKLNPKWKFKDIEEEFKQNYLGASDYQRLSKQVEEMMQRPSEPICQFIPRMKELLLLLEPNMSEREQMRNISLKVRSDYKQWIAYSEPQTVEQLKKCCMKVEAGMPTGLENKTTFKGHDSRKSDYSRSTRKGSSSKPFRPKPSKGSYEKPRDPKAMVCYRCNRKGHISGDCHAKTKLDGSPLSKKGGEKSVNRVTEQPEQVQLRGGQLTVKRRINAIYACNAQQRSYASAAGNSKSPPQQQRGKGKHIMQSMSFNGVKLPALLDTGSWVTVISEHVANTHGWDVGPVVQPLSGAGGEKLNCVGSATMKVELTLGHYTKSIDYKITVVKGLAEQALVGLDLMDAFDVIIHTKKRLLSFDQNSVKPGVSLARNETVPARTMRIVPTIINAIGTALTIPSGSYEDSILVANSISSIESNRAEAVLLNYGEQPIELAAGKQIANYELLDSPRVSESLEAVRAIVPLAKTQETICIGDQLWPEQVKQLNMLLSRHLEAFSINGEIGCTDLVQHSIELIDNAKPFVEPLRRRPLMHVEETRNQVKRMLEDGIIEESNSPWASAYVLAKKKSGELRLCIDFRRLNNSTKKLVYPLPNIEDCLETLAGKTYFSLIDFAHGFWQIPVEPASRELTAFRTEDGLFHFKRMPFGLTNAPASFQRMVNALLSGLKGVNLQVFIDDICIATKTWDEHLKLLEQILKVVIKSNLRIKSNKCTFGARKIVFLGHEISEEGIKQEPEKLKALLQLAPPTDANGVRRALGMFSYYRKFVPSFALMAEPLTRLTKKNATFQWGKVEQQAFKDIMSHLAKNAVLKHFDHKDPITVKTDASKQGVAGMLLQKNNGDLKIVSCCSRRLSPSEENYGITDLEGLAVVYTLTKFRHYLLGKQFDLVVDHCALCVLKEKTPTSARLRRWAIILSEFNFNVIYSKGDLHKDIDCLSRAPVDDPVDAYLENRLYHIATPLERARWTNNYEDNETRDILEKAKQNQDDFNLRQGVIYRHDKLFVPSSSRQTILTDYHDNPIAGHGGREQTYRSLQALFWWPTMKEDVDKFVEACQICQARKAERAKQAGSMHSFQVCEPNSLIAVDCLGRITQTLKGNQHIIVAVDVFTKFVDAKAVPEISGSQFAEFLCEWCGRYGVPKAILTDNAKTFRNKMVEDLTKVFQTKHLTSAPEHSRGNAVAERAIQTLQEKMALIMRQSQTAENNWDLVLPVALLSMNTSYHKSTGYTPYQMTFGRRHAYQGSLTTTADLSAFDLHAQLVYQQLKRYHEAATEALEDAKDRSRTYFERQHRSISFKIGDTVWVKTVKRRSKLSDRYKGPYTVIKRDNDIYTLRQVQGHQTIMRHVSALKAHKIADEAPAVDESGKPMGDNADPPTRTEPPSSQAGRDDEEEIESPPFEPLTPPPEIESPPFEPLTPPSERAEPSAHAGMMAPPVLVDCLAMPEHSEGEVHMDKDGNPPPPPKLKVRRAARGGGKAPPKPRHSKKGTAIAYIGLALATLIATTYGMVFTKSQTVLWKPTSYIVDQGTAAYAIEIQFANPCDVLKRTKGNTAVEQPVLRVLEECTAVFNRSILNRLDQVKPPPQPKAPLMRQKRFLLEFITGMYVSNLIHTWLDKIFPDTKYVDLSFHLQETTVKIKQLQEATNLTGLIAQAIGNDLSIVNQRLDRLENATNTFPYLSMVVGQILIKIEETQQQLSGLMFNMKHSRLNIETIRQLTDSDWPSDIDITSILPLTCISKRKGHLRIEFYAKRVAQDAAVFQADTFRIWVNLTTSPTLIKYNGPELLLHNYSSTCTKGIEYPQGSSTRDICDIPNYDDPNLSMWNQIDKATGLDRLPNKTIVKETYDSSLKNPFWAIYCFPMEITIDDLTDHCPSFPFLVPIHTKWNTSDASSHQFLLNMTNEWRSYQAPYSSTHGELSIQPMSDGGNVKKIFQLTQQLREKSKSDMITIYANNEINRSTAMNILISISAISIAIALVLSIRLLYARANNDALSKQPACSAKSITTRSASETMSQSKELSALKDSSRKYYIRRSIQLK